MKSLRVRRRLLVVLGVVMAVLPLAVQSAHAVSPTTDTWAPFPVAYDIYSGNNGHEFYVSTGGAGDCPLYANFKVIADPTAFTDQTLELTTEAYGFPACWPSDPSSVAHDKIELEFFDWSSTNGSPFSIYTLNVEPGFNVYFPAILSSHLLYFHGLTLVKMWMWVSSTDYSTHSQITVPFDTRMCNRSTSEPGKPDYDCGQQPNITINTDSNAALAPPLPPTVAATDLVSVGDSSTAPFDQALSDAYNAVSPAPASKYYSIASTGGSPLFTKTGAGVMARPDGSAQGLTALWNNVHDTVDIARSSIGPNTTTDKASEYYIAYAENGIGWAAPTGGNAPPNLTTADLQGIYECSITTWSQITDIPGYTGPDSAIKAYLPPAGSGTRENFLAATGVYPSPPGPCVQTVTPRPDEGTDPVLQNNPDAIVPYSIGHYAGQTTYDHSSGSDAPGVLDAHRSIDGTPQIDSTGNLNPDFLNNNFAYGYNLYYVVRPDDWADPALGPPLKALLGRATNNGWLCTNGTSLIKNYGFVPLRANECGAMSEG